MEQIYVVTATMLMSNPLQTIPVKVFRDKSNAEKWMSKNREDMVVLKITELELN